MLLSHPGEYTYNLARVQQAGVDPQPSRPYEKRSRSVLNELLIIGMNFARIF